MSDSLNYSGVGVSGSGNNTSMNSVVPSNNTNKTLPSTGASDENGLHQLGLLTMLAGLGALLGRKRKDKKENIQEK
ncbi:LPXTG cell wall anchor domain-containing protein [Lactococcus garvieae]